MSWFYIVYKLESGHLIRLSVVYDKTCTDRKTVDELNFKVFFIALFKNTLTLKVKSQLTFAFFAAVNHLSGPLRKQNFTYTGSKCHGL